MKNKTLLTMLPINLVLVGVFLFVIAGCSSHIDRVKIKEPARVFKEKISTPPVGSIWPGENAKNSLFTDNKARHVNDILTIVIDEYSSGNNSADTATSKNTSTLAEVSSFLGVEKYIGRRNKDLTNGDMATGGLLPLMQIGGSSKNSLTGKGETSRDGKLKAKITARVVKVMDNGNLAIEGRRQLTVNAEEQYIIISGVVRPEDVTSDNVISSQYIADARIVYTGKGVVNDKMRAGWLTRIVDWTWPF
jgi:flagellar L-ring protein FlgH